MTGKELVDKSIQYHDPNNSWATFSAELKITMETPSGDPRISSVFFDLQKEYFRNQYNSDSNIIFQEINKGVCSILFNGKAKFTPEEEKKNTVSPVIKPNEQEITTPICMDFR